MRIPILILVFIINLGTIYSVLLLLEFEIHSLLQYKVSKLVLKTVSFVTNVLELILDARYTTWTGDGIGGKPAQEQTIVALR